SRRPPAAFAVQLRRAWGLDDLLIVSRAREPSSELRQSSPVAALATRLRRRHPAAASGSAFFARAVVAAGGQAPQAASQSHPAAESASAVAGAEPSRTGSSSCPA